MNPLEKLMNEFGNELTFEFSDTLPVFVNGYIIGNHVIINAKLPFDKATYVLAEEIGHHKTAVGNILDYNDPSSWKLEKKGRQWAYK